MLIFPYYILTLMNDEDSTRLHKRKLNKEFYNLPRPRHMYVCTGVIFNFFPLREKRKLQEKWYVKRPQTKKYVYTINNEIHLYRYAKMNPFPSFNSIPF